MWQGSNPKGKGRSRGTHGSRRPIHIKRVTLELRKAPLPGQGLPQENSSAIQARILLNNLSPLGIELYCAHQLLVGDEVTLALSDPRTLYLRGKVLYCQHHDTGGHIISQTPFDFRTGIQLLFESNEELETVKSFCAEIQSKLVPAA